MWKTKKIANFCWTIHFLHAFQPPSIQLPPPIILEIASAKVISHPRALDLKDIVQPSFMTSQPIWQQWINVLKTIFSLVFWDKAILLGFYALLLFSGSFCWLILLFCLSLLKFLEVLFLDSCPFSSYTLSHYCSYLPCVSETQICISSSNESLQSLRYVYLAYMVSSHGGLTSTPNITCPNLNLPFYLQPPSEFPTKYSITTIPGHSKARNLDIVLD